MRSLFAPRERQDQPPVPEATESTPTAAPSPDAPLQAGPAPQIEARLFAAMDGMAATLLEALSQPLNGEQVAIDINLKLKVMTQAQDWMLKRERLKPKDDSEDGDGINDLRRRLKDPREWVPEFLNDPEFIHALEVHGWLRPLPYRPKGGRPTQEEAKLKAKREQRERAHENVKAEDDDSALARMLRDAEKNPHNDGDQE